MPRMSEAEIERRLAEPHCSVLSVSRTKKGPVSVPVWFVWQSPLFRIITSPQALHSRIMQSTGRATVIVHGEHYGDNDSLEWYVIAEGPIRFTDEDLATGVYEAREKYYRNARAPEWVRKPTPPQTLAQRVAVMRPERISGFEWREQL